MSSCNLCGPFILHRVIEIDTDSSRCNITGARDAFFVSDSISETKRPPAANDSRDRELVNVDSFSVESGLGWVFFTSSKWNCRS